MRKSVWLLLFLSSLSALASTAPAPVSIDQSTPGTTNKVDIGSNGSVVLGAGAALIGKTGFDQTTPGTTNAVSHAYIGTAATAVGSGASNTGTQRVIIATDQPAFPVSSSPSFGTRADTYTTATTGTTVDDHLAPVKSFVLAVKATGSVTSWTVVLECSLDNANFTTLLTHTNVSPGDGQAIFTGTSLLPCLYYRSKVSAITLGAGTNVVATILGM